MGRLLAISAALFITFTASAHPTTLTAFGAKEAFDCEGGKGKMSGLYETDRGGFVCVRDYGKTIEVFAPEQGFSARLAPDLKGTELTGRIYLTGWGWRETHTSVGLIGEQMTCPFTVGLNVFPLGDDDMLWEYPIVSYDTACCNFGGVRYLQEHLTRAH